MYLILLTFLSWLHDDTEGLAINSTLKREFLLSPPLPWPAAPGVPHGLEPGCRASLDARKDGKQGCCLSGCRMRGTNRQEVLERLFRSHLPLSSITCHLSWGVGSEAEWPSRTQHPGLWAVLWHKWDVQALRVSLPLHWQATEKKEQNILCLRIWGQESREEWGLEGWEWNRARSQGHWAREAHRGPLKVHIRGGKRGNERCCALATGITSVDGLPRTDGMEACCGPSQSGAVWYGPSDLLVCPDCRGKTEVTQSNLICQ